MTRPASIDDVEVVDGCDGGASRCHAANRYSGSHATAPGGAIRIDALKTLRAIWSSGSIAHSLLLYKRNDKLYISALCGKRMQTPHLSQNPVTIYA